MKYIIDNVTGNKLSILGLGCMRFKTDKKETERMILKAVEMGVNFFDTAYIYPGSEKTLGEILAKNNLRDKVFVSTKLPFLKCRQYADFDKFFFEQLGRLQTSYIDYYFLHNINSFDQWKTYQEMGIENWIQEKKTSSQIKQIGFSFHGTTKDFIKIIDSYNWEFCMIQYNYSDENYQAGKIGLKAAAKKNIPIFIMEPLLGGRLATGLPEEAVRIFNKYDNTRKPAEWAFRWLWNQPEISVVLSGMNTEEMMIENITSANRFSPIIQEEHEVYDEVIDEFKRAYKIKCTACNYCLPCPKGINIPACFSAYNNSYSQKFITGMMLYVTSTAANTANPRGASTCIECGICVKKCPQNINIPEDLKTVARRFESLPLRTGMKIVRRVMNGKL